MYMPTHRCIVKKIKLNILTTERILGLGNKPHWGESGGGVDDPRPATLQLTAGSSVGAIMPQVDGWNRQNTHLWESRVSWEKFYPDTGSSFPAAFTWR